MIGKTILHYKILSKLGEGGMGVVYKAEDSKLKREVAIKFLPRQIAASDEERERFKIEAQAAAALNHANIATIHSIEKTDDETFIVMEYIKGQELKDKIDAGPLPIDDTLNIAIQIAQGLQAAHEEGVVHRDIKSANIMLTHKGDVKIMDFGLAKRGGQTKLTKEGTTLGTVAYMSPEQTRGENVDQRSDLFSLGVLLYEMLTGQVPFKGDYDQAVTYSILNEEPEPVTGLRTGIPMELERIVNKCLKKDASGRYQQADELIADLGELKESELRQTRIGTVDGAPSKNKRKPWLLPTAMIGFVILVLALYWTMNNRAEVGTTRIMLAVLPFENRGLPEDEYFADGITEEITSRLAEIGQLGVIARTSASTYKNSNKSIVEIGEELGIEYILEGTVRWDRQAGADSRVRVTPELIKVSDETHLWTGRYDAVLADVFQIQSDISEQVAKALEIKLLDNEIKALKAQPTKNLEAYNYYLRGKDYHARAMIKNEAHIAIQMYEKAVELDPNFAMAYSSLSRIRSWMHFYGYKDQLPFAREALDRARQLAPDLVETNLALGYYYYYGNRDYDKAIEHFTIAQRHEPNNAEVIQAIGLIWRRQGKWKQAEIQHEQAVELDPRNHTLLRTLGQIYLYTRQYSQAERYLNRAISVAPNIRAAYINKVQLYQSWPDRTERADQVLEAAVGRIGQEALDRKLWAQALATFGSSDSTDYYLENAETQYYAEKMQLAAHYADSARIILLTEIQAQPENHQLHMLLAWAYAYQGRHEDAIREAEKAVKLVPVSKDAYLGCKLVQSLALLYTVVGEHDAAIDRLEYLLTVPSLISVARLKSQPEWEPLHEHVRFKELLAKHT